MFTQNDALAAVQRHNNIKPITVTDIVAALATSKQQNCTFGGITTVTEPKLAAANIGQQIVKISKYSVFLGNTQTQVQTTYASLVKKTATNLAGSDLVALAAINAYIPSANFYNHTACYSVVEHPTKPLTYLYLVVNSIHRPTSYYYNKLTHKFMTKAEVAAYMTPSGKKLLLNPPAHVMNVLHGIEHDANVRTVGVNNIVNLNLNQIALIAV